jgi:hypothetical protein
MNSLARKFYELGGEANFQEVLVLSEESQSDWSAISERTPDLPRGWFELSRISPEERIEFVRDTWFEILPYHPIAHPAFSDFFARLDDIAIVLAKQDGSLQPEMVYSLADNSTFFRGLPPAAEEDVREFKTEIGSPLPRDYLSFLRVHNGFGKLSEIGVLRIEDVGDAVRRARNLLLSAEKPVRSGGRAVDPASLIPFYEAYGLGSYQCFFADWYPGSEMGNVYLSGIDYTISETSDRKAWGENLAFTTFLEWLAYYLQGMNVSP